MIGTLGPRLAHYAGDLERDEALGQIVGPNTFREFLTACGAEYNADTGRTTIWYRYATVDELAAATPAPTPRVYGMPA